MFKVFIVLPLYSRLSTLILLLRIYTLKVPLRNYSCIINLISIFPYLEENTVNTMGRFLFIGGVDA